MFPEQINSFEQSVIFMKRLLGISICSITYLRLMFPEDAYVDKSLEGWCFLHLLKIQIINFPILHIVTYKILLENTKKYFQ